MLTTDEESSTNKKIPKVDFSVFTMADGTVVSTKDRVIKGKKCKAYVGLKGLFKMGIKQRWHLLLFN